MIESGELIELWDISIDGSYLLNVTILLIRRPLIERKGYGTLIKDCNA